MVGVDVAALRAITPGCAHRNHLNNAGAALMTTTTLTAMTDHLALEAEIGGYEAAAAAGDRIAATTRNLATLVGGLPEEIALFDNSTHAWQAACYAVPLEPGDRILTGRDEYGSNVLALWHIAARAGAEVVVVPDDEHGQIDVEALAALVDDRTKLICLTWVPTSGGLVNPAASVGRVARDADVLYLLDATQAVGQFPVDVATIGCDVLCGTGRKFLRGPRGTGFLWAGLRALDRFEPAVAEIESATWDGADGFSWAYGARRFGTWEHSYVNVIGLGAAVEQALELGLDAIGARCDGLGRRLRDGLEDLSGVTTHDLGADRCAIVTATVTGWPADEVAAALAARGINVSTTAREHNPLDTGARDVHPLVRLSPHCYNTDDEIDAAIEAITMISRRT